MGIHEDLLKDPEYRKFCDEKGNFVLDRSRAWPLLSKVCSNCDRLRDPGERHCDAFGAQTIPDDIWFGRDDHRSPVPGDGGKTFTPRLAR